MTIFMNKNNNGFSTKIKIVCEQIKLISKNNQAVKNRIAVCENKFSQTSLSDRSMLFSTITSNTELTSIYFLMIALCFYLSFFKKLVLFKCVNKLIYLHKIISLIKFMTIL